MSQTKVVSSRFPQLGRPRVRQAFVLPSTGPGRCIRLWRWLCGLMWWVWQALQRLGRGRLLLVLDLDGTLVCPVYVSGPGAHTVYTQGQWICITFRPHLWHFLDFVSSRFDLVVFTASQRDYAEKVMNLLQLNVPLYSREHCTLVTEGYEKDLRIFRKPLSQVLLLDDNAFCYRRQPASGLAISGWNGDLEDKELLRVMEVLAAR